MKIDEKIWQRSIEDVIAFCEPEVKIQAKKQKKSEEEIRTQFRAVIEAKKTSLKYFSFSFYGNIADYGWVAYYEYFIKSGVIQTTENFEKMKDFLMTGIYDQIQLNDVCIICEHPEYVHWDTEGRLHCVDGYSIKWKDDFSLCSWHGVVVPSKLVFFPEMITKEDLNKEDNAEVRRCFQEKLGEERFAELLETEVIDSTTDLSGRPLQLVRTKEADPVAGEKINYIVVQDHSTPRKYWICVPPEFLDARTALAWTAECKDWKEYSKLQHES